MSVGQLSPKRIVGVEEHFLLPDLLRRIPEIATRERGYFSRDQPYAGFSRIAQLSDTAEERLRVLDEAGVSMQVPSPDGPGADLLSSWEGAAWAREAKKPMTPSLVLSPLIQIASPAWRIYRLRVPMPPQTDSSGASSCSR